MGARPPRSRTAAFFFSWLSHVIGALCLVGVICVVTTGNEEIGFLSLARWFLLGVTLGTAYWMAAAWILVVEGPLRHAEYGGTENRLKRLVFEDRPAWQLKQPLPILVSSGRRPGFCVLVSVWEDFLGHNKIMYRVVNCYTGESVQPENEDDWI